MVDTPIKIVVCGPVCLTNVQGYFAGSLRGSMHTVKSQDFDREREKVAFLVNLKCGNYATFRGMEKKGSHKRVELTIQGCQRNQQWNQY
jgi:hypothetical protein